MRTAREIKQLLMHWVGRRCRHRQLALGAERVGIDGVAGVVVRELRKPPARRSILVLTAVCEAFDGSDALLPLEAIVRIGAASVFSIVPAVNGRDLSKVALRSYGCIRPNSKLRVCEHVGIESVDDAVTHDLFGARGSHSKEVGVGVVLGASVTDNVEHKVIVDEYVTIERAQCACKRRVESRIAILVLERARTGNVEALE